MLRNLLVLSAVISNVFLSENEANAADRNQIRGERCLSTANYIILNHSTEINAEISDELDKNVRCVARLLQDKPEIEARKKNSNKGNAGKGKGGKGKAGKGKGNKNKGGKGGKGNSKNNKPTCAEELKDNQAQRAVIVKKRDDCVAAANLIEHYAIKIDVKDKCHDDFYAEINKIPFIFCDSKGNKIVHQPD